MLTDMIIANTFQGDIVMIEFLSASKRIGCHFYNTLENIGGLPPFLFQTSFVNDQIEIHFTPRKKPIQVVQFTPLIEALMNDDLLQSLRIKNASQIIPIRNKSTFSKRNSSHL